MPRLYVREAIVQPSQNRGDLIYIVFEEHNISKPLVILTRYEAREFLDELANELNFSLVEDPDVLR